MLAYRSESRPVDVSDVLSDLETRIAMLGPAAGSSLETLRSVLIDLGELEAALVDMECEREDDSSALSGALSASICSVARLFVRAWRGGETDRAAVDDALGRLRALGAFSLPEAIHVSVPEGFAFYGLFPETYLDAADDLAQAWAPRSVVVVGIRSIGTTLSAAVAAALAERRIATERITVRPRGHPFDRELCLSRRLVAHLIEAAASDETMFAIVDEGPGLSGSSFASVVGALASLGVPDDRIALFPSWDPAPEALSNEGARRVWRRCVKFLGDFDRAWLASGRLARAFGATVVRDLSAGGWRSLLYPDGNGPAAQPQHERRKLLVRRGSDEHMLVKFTGLDRAASVRRARAQRMADAGFGAAVEGFAHGFLATRWLEGAPLPVGMRAPDFLRRVGRYLGWIACVERTGRAADPLPLLEMLRVNVTEGLGPQWGAVAVEQALAAAPSVACAPAVRVDGRLLPHEWVRTGSGFVKTDGAFHFDDHFYPGETDIAWDLAGALIELELDGAGEQMLVREYRRASGDDNIEPRLQFMRPAYAAFRLGYTTLGAAALGDNRDGLRMRQQSVRYADALGRALSLDRSHGQSCAAGR